MACPFAGPDAGSSRASPNPSHNQLTGEIAGVPTKLKKGADPISYHEYLQIDRLLSCQKLRSAEYNDPAHDELLFITTHQVYELWFKQTLHEIRSVIQLFADESSAADESTMLKITERLGRVVQILKVCVSQMGVLMTMTPMEFANFRDYLVPASGFQSVQFRILENTLGLTTKNRIQYHKQDYKTALDFEHQAKVAESESATSLLQSVEAWLERNPAMRSSWWTQIESNIQAYHAENRKDAQDEPDAATRETLLDGCLQNEQCFKQLFDEEVHNNLFLKGKRKISLRALRSAFMINLFRDKPRFQSPFMILQNLMDIDNELIEWRHKHAGMVQRMIGNKMGTGGSSGYMYLRATVSDRYKVFLDISTLSTFLMPKELVPALSDETDLNLSHSTPINPATPNRPSKIARLS